MVSRDDMVIRPKLGRGATGEGTSAQSRAREERRFSSAKKKRGAIRRMLRAKAAKSILIKRRKKIAKRRARLGGRGFLGLGRFAKFGGQVASRLNPVAIGATLGIGATGVAARLGTGRSFQNMGQQLNNIVLGDSDDLARASMTARSRVTGQSNLLRIIGQEGRVNSQIASLYDDFKVMAFREEKGRSLIESDMRMQDNGVFDMLILRGRDAFVTAFKGSGGLAALDRLQAKRAEATMSPVNASEH